MTTTRQKVAEIFSMVLNCPVDSSEDLVRENVEAWDSIKHVELIFALEEAFDVQFSEDEIAELDRLSEVVDWLEQNHEA